MNPKPKLREAVAVEGRYDAHAVRAAVDTLREEKQRQGGQDATPLEDIGRLLAEKRKQKK